MSAIVLDVLGLPAPQGSKRAFVDPRGFARMNESSGDKLKVWRADVKAAVLEHTEAHEPWQPLDGPLSLTIVFKFLRGVGHYRTGKSTHHLLKDNAPAFPTTGSTGDIDKLVRATLDALAIAGLFVNDKQIAHVEAWKVFTHGTDARPGARIEVRTLDDAAAVPVADSQEVLL